MMLDSSFVRAASYMVQRQIVHPRARRVVSRMIAAARPRAEVVPSPLASSGYLELGRALTQQQIEEIRTALGQGPLHDPYMKGAPEFTLERVPADVHLGQFSRSALIRAPHVLQLANRPDIIAHAAAVIGGKPTIHDLLTWWSFPVAAGPADSQLWHRDCADWKMVKLFVYLTDVDPDAGPHVYARNSVQSNELTGVRRFSDEEVSLRFKDIVTVVGQAGSAVMTDPRGLHRAALPKQRRRWVFEASYGLMGLPEQTYRPGIEKVKIKRADLGVIDPWTNRFFVEPV